MIPIEFNSNIPQKEAVWATGVIAGKNEQNLPPLIIEALRCKSSVQTVEAFITLESSVRRFIAVKPESDHESARKSRKKQELLSSEKLEKEMSASSFLIYEK